MSDIIRWLVPDYCVREAILRLRDTRNRMIKERDDARGELAMTCVNMEGEYESLREERDEAKEKATVAIKCNQELKAQLKQANEELLKKNEDLHEALGLKHALDT